ncbi:hypothetical protein AGMMS4956_08360 [Bacteroidia bacterium]|nr:hypothetical protein AGMMS4956_08360 [Bacteroidia bacterium]
MVLDIIFVALLVYAIVMGIRKGLVVQAIELVAVLLGVYFSYKFSYLVAQWGFQKLHLSSPVMGIISFAVTFLIVVILARILSKILHKLVNIALLGGVNRWLGVLFAFVKTLFLTSVVLFILNMVNTQIPILPAQQVQKSKFYQPVSSFAPFVFSYLNIEKLTTVALKLDKDVTETVEKIEETTKKK